MRMYWSVTLNERTVWHREGSAICILLISDGWRWRGDGSLRKTAVLQSNSKLPDVLWVYKLSATSSKQTHEWHKLLSLILTHPFWWGALTPVVIDDLDRPHPGVSSALTIGRQITAPDACNTPPPQSTHTHTHTSYSHIIYSPSPSHCFCIYLYRVLPPHPSRTHLCKWKWSFLHVLILFNLIESQNICYLWPWQWATECPQ